MVLVRFVLNFTVRFCRIRFLTRTVVKYGMDKKSLKDSKESLQKSINNAENSKVLSVAAGNKRASESAERVIDALKKRLQALKGPK
jgi:hypothetical protein